MGLIASANVVAVAGHTNPDGDAVGAMNAMAGCVARMWKSVFVFTEDYSERFNCIPGGGFRYTGDSDLLCPDLFISLDCGSKERLGKFMGLFDRSAATVNIDHHETNPCYADVNLVDAEASSTCEIIFDLINMYVLIDPEIAAALYAGLVYDTGGFRHVNATSKAYGIAARLIDVGFDHSGLYNELMHIRSFTEAKCFGKALNNMFTVRSGRVAASLVTAEELKELKADGKDVDGISEYLLGIRGVSASVFAYAKSEEVTQLSFRSKTVDVGQIARELGGGGHRYAAGCKLSCGAEEALKNGVDALTAAGA